ncbi:hypothetical protein BB560_005783, partial [Smittium megazygosporum]
MKFLALLTVLSSVGTALAQSASTTGPVVSAFLTEQQQCVVSKCNNDYANVGCVAECFGVPNPNESMINKTADCYKTCQDKNLAGTDMENCIDTCISAYYNPS